MNKRQKEVVTYQLKSERDVLKELERQYDESLKGIDQQILEYQQMHDSPSKVYRIEYQRRMKQQVEAQLELLHSNNYQTIYQYLRDVYTNGYVGTMYDLHGQNIPVIAPIDPKSVIRAVTLDSQLKEPLYESLGVDVKHLKKTISSEISRGISSGLLFEDIARNVHAKTKAPLSRAKTIVRTEGHRIQEASAEDARQVAKSKGADVVKQWDATLDGKTRENHRLLDGQIRETDEPFEIAGKKAMYPGDFGYAEEDCNCRCLALTRARKALDADELKTMQERARYFGLLADDSKDFGHQKGKTTFAGFKGKYMKAAKTLEKSGKSGIIDIGKDPFYDGLTANDIATRYKRPDGGNLLDRSFMNMSLDTQRETIRGYDTAISMYGNIPPQRLKAGRLNGGKFAEYSLDFRTITFNEAEISVPGQAYATVIHEMTHHAENSGLFDSKSIVNSAFKKIGIRSNSKPADTLRMRTVGLMKGNGWKDNREVVAYAVERQMTGKKNPLTEAIYSVLQEKGVIK